MVLVLCVAGFAIAGLRPLWVFVPLGVVLSGITSGEYLTHVHGGRLRPLWEFAFVMALAFALLALAGELWRGEVHQRKIGA